MQPFGAKPVGNGGSAVDGVVQGEPREREHQSGAPDSCALILGVVNQKGHIYGSRRAWIFTSVAVLERIPNEVSSATR
jgi:hypothetical protein